MVIFDTNIFIYLANGILDIQSIKNTDLAFSSIVKVEALGYSQITVVEQSYLEALFAECQQLDLEEPILLRAIRLRQQQKMSLGDSIVAASALEFDCELWTANIEDFDHIDGLRLHNPLKH
jgi:predicted nucleic acid-binding protein